jgi:hypothetical protein
MDEMTTEAPDDALLRRYLLGEATEDEEARIERHLFADASGLDRLEMAEDDLFEAFARGDLSAADRRRVLAGLSASSTGRARLALARDLAHFADGNTKTLPSLPTPPPRPSRPLWQDWRLRSAALAAALVLAVVVPYQLHRGRRPAPPPPARSLAPAVFELSLSAERGLAKMPQLRVPPGSQRVELRLVLEERELYRAYRAVLHDASDRTVASAGGLTARPTAAGPEIVLTVPAADLPPGRYEVAVQGERDQGGVEDLAFKEFAVIR